MRSRTIAACLAQPDNGTLAPSRTFAKHMAAIQSGTITGSTIIGLRKAFNADAQRPYNGRTSPDIGPAHIEAYYQAIITHKPHVAGDWLQSGIDQLQSKRYRSRWNPRQAAIIADIAAIRLIDIDWIDAQHCHMIYQAIGTNGDKLIYSTIPWQSGGNGPNAELV